MSCFILIPAAEQQSLEASSEDELIVPPVMSGDLTIEHCSCCKYALVSVGEFNCLY